MVLWFYVRHAGNPSVSWKIQTSTFPPIFWLKWSLTSQQLLSTRCKQFPSHMQQTWTVPVEIYWCPNVICLFLRRKFYLLLQGEQLGHFLRPSNKAVQIFATEFREDSPTNRQRVLGNSSSVQHTSRNVTTNNIYEVIMGTGRGPLSENSPL